MVTTVEVSNLTKKYYQGNSVVFGAKDVNLKIKHGELISIVGRSGSGKSTLLNLLSGIDTPTSGKISIAGKSILDMSDSDLTKFRAKHIGIIFQNYNLIDELNVLENIRLPLDLGKSKYDKNFENDLLTLLDLKERIKFRPSQLSGGQQQRVAIARALITRPDIVLADEPTGNLDKASGDAFFDFIINANKKYNQTFVIVTHNQELAYRTNRIITIDDGVIISDNNIS
ncbi:ABC transporter ATP-binding protein [Eubacterium sp.]|uniref:ABC transporter ATP-binding protein n=1 Tax=uncultured Eubacterium sp. TaxID=165185 RepID=UPI002632A097|nr:ABC transporter ATP-binding protein [uncultured Eubacterium sp.]